MTLVDRTVDTSEAYAVAYYRKSKTAYRVNQLYAVIRMENNIQQQP